MKKIAFFSLTVMAAFVVLASAAQGVVSVTSGPTSLVPDPILVKQSSNPVPLFEFALNQDAGETLTSVAITINNAASSTATSTDIAKVEVYKDDGDNSFDSGDLLAGSQTTVNIGTVTAITTASNNTLNGSKFFVTFSTSATWNDSSPADSITATLASDGIITSANSPTVTAVTTNTITADTTGPDLVRVVAKNTGGTANKEAGDTVELTFSEPTSKPTINAGNINSVLLLNNSHSWLDGAGALGGAIWSVDGKALIVTLSASTTLPTVSPGDVVTVSGNIITDLAGNNASGSEIITGNFSSAVFDDDDDEGTARTRCSNGLINGRLYKTADSPTVYLAAACRLKAFRGAAVFHARGLKFQPGNITVLSSLDNITISERPVLPAEGTLIKGSDATVWFVTKDKKRRGFVSAAVFRALGFRFEQVQQITDSDLNLIASDSPIESASSHPDGALIKCGNSPLVFQIIGKMKFPFANAAAFQNRGHAFTHILEVDCGRFRYLQGAPIEQ